MPTRLVCITAMACALTACGAKPVDVEFYFATGHHFSGTERTRIEAVAQQTASEVRALLPQVPPKLLLKVYAGTDVIPETGETATAFPPATVIWTVDPAQPGGVVGVVDRQLRATLFHEFHHLVRNATVRRESLLDEAISEGMATVFEDAAGPRQPWGVYGPEVIGWLEELQSVPPDARRKDWFVQHPDGRRWIGYRVGAFVTDRAIQASGRSAASMVTASTQDILALAHLQPAVAGRSTLP